jgi:hypothetical protein
MTAAAAAAAAAQREFYLDDPQRLKTFCLQIL